VENWNNPLGFLIPATEVIPNIMFEIPVSASLHRNDNAYSTILKKTPALRGFKPKNAYYLIPLKTETPTGMTVGLVTILKEISNLPFE